MTRDQVMMLYEGVEGSADFAKKQTNAASLADGAAGYDLFVN